MDPSTPIDAGPTWISAGSGVGITHKIGDLVLISPDTNPWVPPRHSCGFTGRIMGGPYEDGSYLVRNVLAELGRSIAIDSRRLTAGCLDGLSSLHARGGRADSSVSRALSVEKLSAKCASTEAEEARAKTATLQMKLAKEIKRRKQAETAAATSKK